GTGDQRDARKSGDHRCKVAKLVNRNVVGVERLLSTADLGHVAVAVGPLTTRVHANGIEQYGCLVERRVGDEDVLVDLALDLEPRRLHADERIGHQVIAATAVEDDGEAVVLVRFRRAGGLVDGRRRGGEDVLEWLLVRTDHLPADDVGRVLGVERGRKRSNAPENHEKQQEIEPTRHKSLDAMAMSADLSYYAPTASGVGFRAPFARSRYFRSRYSVPKDSLDFSRSTRWVLSSANQTSAWPFSEKRPLDLMTGSTTMASNVPAGTVIGSRRTTLITIGLRSGCQYRLNS